MPYVTSCCFGFDLQTGTFLILVLTYLTTETFDHFWNVFSDIIFLLLETYNVVYFELFDLLYFICAMIAVYGLIKRREGFLVPMLIFQTIFVLVMAVAVVVYIIKLGRKEALVGHLGGLIITLVIQGYFGIVMYSYYQQLTGQ